jgi:hypothetical protein
MDPVKNDPNSWHDEMQRWARRRQEQLELAQKKGGISLTDKIWYGPKNLYSSIALDLSKRWHKGEDDYRKEGVDPNSIDHMKVYESMLDKASRGEKPTTKEAVKEKWLFEDLARHGYPKR